jgi:DNA-binding NtrC family response regulator
MLVEQFLPANSRGAIAPSLLREIAQRPWLGNVRELRNFVERAVALGTDEALAISSTGAARGSVDAGSADLPSVPLDQPFKDVRERWLDHLEREYVRGLLAHHDGNVSAVAQASGLTRAYVHRLIRKHDL